MIKKRRRGLKKGQNTWSRKYVQLQPRNTRGEWVKINKREMEKESRKVEL